MAAFLAAAPIVAVISLLGADPTAEGWFGIVAHGFNRHDWDLGSFLLVMLAYMSFVLVAFAGLVVRPIGNRLRVRFETLWYLVAIAGFAACLAYFAVLIVAEANLMLVLAAPWLAGLGLLVLPRVGRWLRPN